jgi:hypothetical protein
MKATMKLVAFAVLVAAPLTAEAQDINFGALDDGANRVSLTAGAEHGLSLGAGYARVVSVADRELVLGGDLTLGWAEVDVDDFRLRGGLLAPIVSHGGWKVIGGLASMIRGTKNYAARMINVGADVSVLAGHYARRWFVAGEVGFDWALATHVDHSEAYRMEVYADARDGWYGNAGGNLRYGVQGGVSFGRNDVILRAGRMQDVAGNPAMIPFYATLTYGARW